MHSQRSRALQCASLADTDPAWCSFTMRALRLVFPRALVPLLPRQSKGWGLQIDLSAELEMGTALFLPSPDRFSASSQGWEARAAVSSARSRHRHFNYLILRNYMLFVSMQEILRIRHLSLVLMRSLLRL